MVFIQLLRKRQVELAQKAGMHLQSVGEIEAGKKTCLNSKSSAGLSKALQVLEEYLDAVCKGVPVGAQRDFVGREQKKSDCDHHICPKNIFRTCYCR